MKTYTASVYYKSTGSTMTKEYPFTQEQANEVGAVLEADGLNELAARKLCNKWTRLGSRGDVIYRYWV
jgi:hypothetical protein